jgi:hypothetical protein
MAYDILRKRNFVFFLTYDYIAHRGYIYKHFYINTCRESTVFQRVE